MRRARQADDTAPTIEVVDAGWTQEGGDPAAAFRREQEARHALNQAKQQAAQALLPYRERVGRYVQARDEDRERARRATVRSPISGTVVALNAQPGQEVRASDRAPLATVVDLRALQVHARVAAGQARYVRPGTRVGVTLGGIPGRELAGTVLQVTSAADGGCVAKVSIDEPDDQVRPGLSAQIDVPTGRSAGAVLAVPTCAVVRHDGQWVCYVQRGGAWTPVPVAPGMTDGQYTVIEHGLHEGQTVEVLPHR